MNKRKKKIIKYKIKLGQVFGQWKVLNKIDYKTFECECSCGTKREIAAYKLLNNKTAKCKKCHNPPSRKKHGMSHSRIYGVWCGMMKRCYYEKHKGFKCYGGRGIVVDNRWHDFEKFYADMGDAGKDMQIDRINNNGPYCPENCRWVTPKENNDNKPKRAV